MTSHPAVTISTSSADDASFRALQDIAELTAGFKDSRIVGGHMVGMLLTAFPSAHAILRRTADADTAISVEVAQTGRLHELLEGAGYRNVMSSNRYEKEPGLVIDVLVPADVTFGSAEHGGRQFDSAPGLRLALQQDPVRLDVDVTMLNGATMLFPVRVPSVEMALVLKSYAYSSRRAAKDVSDIFNLLCIVDEHGKGVTSSGKLGVPPVTGSRLDTTRTLHALADSARGSRAVADARVPAPRLAALIRTYIAPPSR